MLKNKVFFTQTDTTLGFVSQSSEKLNTIKQRPSSKHYIRAINTLDTLKNLTRLPSKYKKQIRRAKRTTFILPNGDSYRVIKQKHHLLLLHRLKWAYTTSANLSGESYNASFAKNHAHITIEPLQGIQQASTILKLGRTKIQRIR
jgi:tRNA A37 threonylcarbamoyladenosine synthetase subunit TsaC/SUA5/YrdC